MPNHASHSANRFAQSAWGLTLALILIGGLPGLDPVQGTRMTTVPTQTDASNRQTPFRSDVPYFNSVPLLFIGHHPAMTASPLPPQPMQPIGEEDPLSISLGSPALNQAFRNANTLEALAEQASEPAAKSLLQSVSDSLYQLSVAQARYEYINGSQSLERMIMEAGSHLPESTDEAVKQVKFCRDRALQSLEALQAYSKLSSRVKTQANQLALDAIQKTDKQYGSLLNRHE